MNLFSIPANLFNSNLLYWYVQKKCDVFFWSSACVCFSAANFCLWLYLLPNSSLFYSMFLLVYSLCLYDCAQSSAICIHLVYSVTQMYCHLYHTYYTNICTVSFVWLTCFVVGFFFALEVVPTVLELRFRSLVSMQYI